MIQVFSMDPGKSELPRGHTSEIVMGTLKCPNPPVINHHCSYLPQKSCNQNKTNRVKQSMLKGRETSFLPCLKCNVLKRTLHVVMSDQEMSRDPPCVWLRLYSDLRETLYVSRCVCVTDSRRRHKWDVKCPSHVWASVHPLPPCHIPSSSPSPICPREPMLWWKCWYGLLWAVFACPCDWVLWSEVPTEKGYTYLLKGNKQG